MTHIAFEGATPRVAPSAYIAPTATLVGQVTIESDAVVMFGAVLRADRAEIILGAGSNIQDNAVVHGDPGFPTTLGRGVSVGHGAIVHGATIGDHCLIGMNATVLNGAVIGEGSMIAAGAVVLEGAVIAPHSLIAGVPGSFRRETTPEERAGIEANAAVYQGLGATYRAAD